MTLQHLTRRFVLIAICEGCNKADLDLQALAAAKRWNLNTTKICRCLRCSMQVRSDGVRNADCKAISRHGRARSVLVAFAVSAA